MRIELAQIRKYSPSDDIVNEIIYFVYDINNDPKSLRFGSGRSIYLLQAGAFLFDFLFQTLKFRTVKKIDQTDSETIT